MIALLDTQDVIPGHLRRIMVDLESGLFDGVLSRSCGKPCVVACRIPITIPDEVAKLECLIFRVDLIDPRRQEVTCSIIWPTPPPIYYEDVPQTILAHEISFVQGNILRLPRGPLDSPSSGRSLALEA